MTEEEEIAYLQEVERVTEEYFRRVGYDIDMSEMSTQELEQFFLGLPAHVQTGLRHHVAMETTGSAPEADVLDFSAAMAMPLMFKGIPIPGSGLLRVLKQPAKLAGKPLRWLGRALGVVDDADEAITYGVTRAVPFRGAGGRFAVDPHAGRTAAGAVGPRPAAGAAATGGRTAAGQIPTTRMPPVIQGAFQASGKATILGGAGMAAVAGAAATGAFDPQQPSVTSDLPAVREEDKTQEQKNREWMEARQALQAETETGPVKAIIDPDQKRIMKQIYYEGLSEEAAFDRLTNYLADSGVNILAESGISLGAAIEQQEASAGLGGTLGEMHVLNLQDPAAREKVRQYLQANWQRIPAIAEGMQVPPQGGFSGGAIPSEQDQQAMVDKKIDEYIVEISRNADTLLLTPENPDGTGDAIGFITSFDGTTHGDIVSFNDMFAGGRIGHMNLLPMLLRARPEQIAMWQQQLYAWGYLENPPEVWGSVEPDAQGNRHTLDAAQRWQVGVVQEGIDMVRQARRAAYQTGPPGAPGPSLSDLITADGTPRADRVLDQAIARQMSGESTRATDARTMRDRVVAQAQDRVGKYLEATGRYLPEGSAMQIQSGLDQVLGGLSAERQESAFGQGGSPYERALAESILGKLSQRNDGTGNWKDMLTFGTTNRDSSFFDYAARVGAVSERERDLLMAGVVNRGTYRDHWRDRHEQLKEAEADVAVAALLKFISQGMTGDFSTVTPTDIARGVNTYMHTVGMQQGLANPISESDLTFLAQEAIAEARGARFQQDDQMLTDVATGGVDQMGLRGGVSGYQFRDLVNQLDSIQSVRKMGVPNV